MKVCKPKNQLDRKASILWAQLKKGSSLALGSLYDMYADDLFCYGIQYSKDRAYIKDCIHDLFFDLYKYRANLSPTDTVKPYLLQSLRRKINEKYRRKILLLHDSPFDLNKLDKNHITSFEDDIVRSEKAAEKSIKVANALKTLTNKQKKGIFLRFNQDRSYEEIAEIMKTSIPTARTTIYRAIRMLRKQPFLLIVFLYSYFFS